MEAARGVILQFQPHGNPRYSARRKEISMSARTTTSAARIRLHTTQAPERLGGETRPYEYPHLYQIQAGDWRISYAVEQNRLAILVLEVLNPDGTVIEDPVRETLTRKMKIKLLDWPEGSPSRDLRPEDLGRKVKIRLLDLAEEASPDGPGQRATTSRVRLSGSSTQKPHSGIRLNEPKASAPRPSERVDESAGVEFLRRQGNAPRFPHDVKRAI